MDSKMNYQDMKKMSNMRPFINVSSVFRNRMLKVYSLHLTFGPTIANMR